MTPYYTTGHGAMFLGDATAVLRDVPDSSISLILTSPPFPLQKKKKYGNEPPDKYNAWFLAFAREFRRILKPDGSLVVEFGSGWNKGKPTRSIYQYEILVSLCRKYKFHLAQDFYWYNTAKLPTPAQWVTVERVRVKDAVTCVWWLSKSDRPKADNRRVLKEYSPSMKLLLQRGYNAGLRPSGHNISDKFGRDNGGAIPPNLLSSANTRSHDDYMQACRDADLPVHPARFPEDIPDFFIRFLTDEGDTVLDPFAGSNLTGYTAERLGRRWVGIEIQEDYVKGSMNRFSVPSVAPRSPLVLEATS